VIGAMFAGIFLDRVPSLVEDVAHLDGSATNVLYGALLVALMFLLPTGIAGLGPLLRARRRPPLSARPEVAPAAAIPATPVPAPKGRTCTPDHERARLSR
jgi:branched-chain amino acid transport system permease protein